MGWKFNLAVSRAPCLPPSPEGLRGSTAESGERGGPRSSPSRAPWLLRFPQTRSTGEQERHCQSREPHGRPSLQSCYSPEHCRSAPPVPVTHRENAALWPLLQLLEIFILRESISHLASIRGTPSHFHLCSPILPGVPAYSSQEVQAKNGKLK